MTISEIGHMQMVSNSTDEWLVRRMQLKENYRDTLTHGSISNGNVYKIIKQIMQCSEDVIGKYMSQFHRE